MEVTPTFLENLDRVGAWGILTTDENLTIIGWNRWLERHSGKRAADVVGRPLFDAFPELIERSLDHYYRDAVGGQAAILSQRFHSHVLSLPPTVATAQCQHMQQTVRISPVFEAGAIRGTLTLIEDVTERVVTEMELRQQAERLEEANRHKDEFLAMLAHELRNPLAPIRNGIRVLEVAGTSNEEARETRRMIERQVAHMARLVDDLLDVSRMIRGNVRLQIEPVEIMTVVRQVAGDYEPILGDHGVKLTVETDGEPCWIMGDSTRLAQIISNLLHNASKFTNEGGEVRLTAQASPDEGAVRIKVSDTGIGMTAETLAHVFEAFSQAQNTLDRTNGGLGLGLALVKGLVELHEGSVAASSAGPAQGSEFIVRLPMNSAVPRPSPSPPEIISEPGEAQRVLLIEDNRDSAHSLRMLLRHAGHDVELAFTGSEGVELASKSQFDVVICDIGLPGIDGFKVAQILRINSACRDARLIALSGYGQSEDVRRARDAGFDLHLTKPVDLGQLLQALHGAGKTVRPS